MEFPFGNFCSNVTAVAKFQSNSCLCWLHLLQEEPPPPTWVYQSLGGRWVCARFDFFFRPFAYSRPVRRSLYCAAAVLIPEGIRSAAWHFGCRCTFLVAITSSRRWNCHNKLLRGRSFGSILECVSSFLFLVDVGFAFGWVRSRRSRIKSNFSSNNRRWDGRR